MASPMKRQSRSGLTFYTTVLVLCVFAAYSLLRSSADRRDQRYDRDPLVARRLHARDKECRLVHKYEDQCAFVRANCPDEEAGLISYLQLYYCHLASAQPVAFIILVIWISLLFSTIGIAASDFLCINLSTIATILGMSESLTGVTFLAFGNGSPDVFSTFAAMSSHSGSLAVGELMGAAGFITAVVAGSMAIVKPFQVARRSFIRDVAFFAVAASFSLVFLADGSLRLWECVTMVGFYVFYVLFVVAWHWWIGRRRRERIREATARLHHHIPETQELEIPEVDDDDEARPAGERTVLLRAQSGDSLPYSEIPGTPAWRLQEIDEDDRERDHYLAELQSNMRVSRYGRERRNTLTPIRPSLIGALEFRSVLSSLQKNSTNNTINLRRYSDDPSPYLVQAGDNLLSISNTELANAQNGNETSLLLSRTGASARGRAVSANDVVGLRLDTHFLELPGSVPETAVYSGGPTPVENSREHHYISSDTGDRPGSNLTPASPQLLVSSPASMDGQRSHYFEHHRQTSGDLLAPPTLSFHHPVYAADHQEQSTSPVQSPRMSPHTKSRPQVPILRLPHLKHMPSPSATKSPVYTDPPLSSTPSHSRPPSIRLPEPSMSPESSGIREYEVDEEALLVFKWWPYSYLPSPQVIASTLFPTIYGWRAKNIWDKMLGLATFLPVFLLTVTLPVVEADDENEQPDPDPGLLTPQGANRSRSSTRIQLPPDSPSNSSTAAPPHLSKSYSRQDLDFAKSRVNQIDEISSVKDWNRWLVFVQIFTAPIFTVVIIWANLDEEYGLKALMLMVIGSLIFSLVCLLILLATSSPEKEPKYRPLFCFLGFLVAIAWISTIANEVVGVLKAFGVILGISDAILGLTIFAVGNSLGDLVADITVARLGYPVMALSACFGGPMLNILLGIGVSGMYMTIHNSTHHHKKHPDSPMRYKPYQIEVSTTLMVSGITLLVTLVGLLIVVPLNGWRMDRKIGWGLITLWSLSTVGNVIVEVLGYGGDLEIVSGG